MGAEIGVSAGVVVGTGVGIVVSASEGVRLGRTPATGVGVGLSKHPRRIIVARIAPQVANLAVDFDIVIPVAAFRSSMPLSYYPANLNTKVLDFVESGGRGTTPSFRLPQVWLRLQAFDYLFAPASVRMRTTSELPYTVAN